MNKKFQIDYPFEQIDFVEFHDFKPKFFKNKTIASVKPNVNFFDNPRKIDLLFESVMELRNRKLFVEIHISPVLYFLFGFLSLVFIAFISQNVLPVYSFVFPIIIIVLIFIRFKNFEKNIKFLIEESKKNHSLF